MNNIPALVVIAALLFVAGARLTDVFWLEKASDEALPVIEESR